MPFQLQMNALAAPSQYKRVANKNQSNKKAQQEEHEQPKRRIRANVKETGFDSMKYYMKTMGNHELLKKNEEIILAREIQVLIKWEETREELEAKLMRYVLLMRATNHCLLSGTLHSQNYFLCIDHLLMLNGQQQFSKE